MDDQSFELLISKLDSLEAGQSRIENQIHARLDKHYALFQAHTEDDRKLAEHIVEVEKEITFAKGVTYTINGIAAAVYGFVGWGK